jgi:D-alanyl-D-alanine dipeptidase
MNKIDLKLNQDAPTLFEMLNIPVRDRIDSFVSLKEKEFPYQVFDKVVPSSTGNDIYVRRSVLDKLKMAQKHLNAMPGFETDRLQVTYGYRSPDIQHQKYIDQIQRFYSHDKDAQTIMEMANIYIACPHTAGHPSGAAIDLWITDENDQPLDFGTDMHDLSEKSSVFNREITEAGYQNRLILRACMMKAGFAPYNGEWWHFSYGDREHALWIGEGEAFYSPCSYDPKTQSFSEWSGLNFNYINFVHNMGETHDK